ncbi:MAG: cytochrome P450 [Pseudomonadota bacterium]
MTELTLSTARGPHGALSHIPGERGLPVVGTTLRILKDPVGYTQRMFDQYGPVYRSRTFGIDQISLLGPEANELVLFDKNKIFSSTYGWSHVLDKLFPRGLMLLDFDYHRHDRRIMQLAFKVGPMRSYVDSLNEGTRAGLRSWAQQAASGDPFEFYPAIKTLTLNLSASPFLGIPWGDDAEQINRAFVDMVQATVAVVRKPLPGTQMRKGVKGRQFMVEWFGREIPKRRGAEGGDMLTLLCNAVDDAGRGFTDQEIIDHMNFLMMAAHDTLTSSMTSMTYFLAQTPEWQQRLAEEASQNLSHGETNEPEISYDALSDMNWTEAAFKEAMRMMPPVPSIPRFAIGDFHFAGHDIPAGTPVAISPYFTHHMPDHWPDPERFDPMRFTDEGGQKTRHKYAWVPFSGGAHMCLGLHFAYMQAKVVFGHFLSQFEVRLPQGYTADFQVWPIPRPRDGLPVQLKMRD